MSKKPDVKDIAKKKSVGSGNFSTEKATSTAGKSKKLSKSKLQKLRGGKLAYADTYVVD